MVGKRGIEGIGLLEVESGSAFQEQVHQRPGGTGIAGLLAGDEQTHRVGGIRAEGHGMDICAGVEEQPRDLDDVPRELAAAGIPGDVMEQMLRR